MDKSGQTQKRPNFRSAHCVKGVDSALKTSSVFTFSGWTHTNKSVLPVQETIARVSEVAVIVMGKIRENVSTDSL